MAVENAFELFFEDFAEWLGIAAKHPATVVVFLESKSEFLNGFEVSDSDQCVGIAGRLGFSLGSLSRLCLGGLILLDFASGFAGAAGAVAGFDAVLRWE